MRELSSVDELKALLDSCNINSTLLVVDFFAVWCGPCNLLAPHFELLASKYPAIYVLFVKVNIDVCKELASIEGIKSIPTFKFYLNNVCMATITGGPISRIEEKIKEIWIAESVKEIYSLQGTSEFFHARAHLTNVSKQALSPHCKTIELKISDPIFEKIYLMIPGCMQFLFDIGFKESDDSLILTADRDVRKIRRLLWQLRGGQPAIIKVNHQLMQRLQSYKEKVASYLDTEAQDAARAVIPYDDLISAAARASQCLPDQVKPVAFLEQLLKWFKQDFFSWVREFTCLTCSGKMTMSAGTPTEIERIKGDASRVEIYTCNNDKTHEKRRFPRYNNAKVLLESRTGRCGEWANCFALILCACRRKSSEAIPWFPGVRFVVDFTDHVWCELWLQNDCGDQIEGRWVHVDPCEGLIDASLVYEAGWRKQLSYVFALTIPPALVPFPNPVNAVDVQDVTWRYTTHFSEVLSRRNEIDERLLANYLLQGHQRSVKCWMDAGVTSDPFTLSLIMLELVEFLQPSKVDPSRNPEVLRGRETGSLEWRSARGELGDKPDTGAAPPVLWEGSSTAIRPTEFELESKCIYLRYNCAMDVYARPFASSEAVPTSEIVHEIRRSSISNNANFSKEYKKGWQSMASRWRNIKRKHEQDWHMAYLARNEDQPSPTQEGSIEWVVDLTGTDFSINEVTLFSTMVSFDEVGKVAFDVCSGNSESTGVCRRLTPGSAPLVSCQDFAGLKQIHLTARLWSDPEESDKVNDPHLNWQKSQLFRQKDSDTQTWPLEWKLTLRRDDQNAVGDGDCN